VALGRAVIREPRVFLFDEPLSNLDARLRADMRAMIKKLYNRLLVTSIYVTHDQVEAMTIGEQLVIMNEGRILQVGSPETCYREPADTFVAAFLGSPPMNFVDASISGGGQSLDIMGQQLPLPAASARLARADGDDVVVGIRPENVIPAEPAGVDTRRILKLEGKIVLEEPLGHETLTHLQVGQYELIARGGSAFECDGEGNTRFFVECETLHVFSKRDGVRLSSSNR
jgi:multiple sugar transport system ATP-binding protein